MRFFRREAKPSRSASLPAGTRIYCIGDIHGRLDLLLNIRAQIAADLSDAPVASAATIFLGDYIDRGPDSFGVLDLLSSDDFPTHIIGLRGNHEQMLLDFLIDPMPAQDWLKFGGLETLHSYDVATSVRSDEAAIRRTQDALAQALPPRHRHFLEDTSISAECGDYFFCHAGIRPGVALADQSEQDLLWIRDAFLNHTRPHPKVIIHGHTPVEAPDVRSNRINVDTGAYVTDRLTCIVLEDCNVRVLAS